MTWLKVDDQLPRNPKVLAAGLEGSWWYLCALAHCAAALTDGFIDRRALNLIAPHLDDPAAAAQACVDAGLVTVVEGGWEVPDFLAYNPSRAKVVAEREAGKLRAAKSRERRQGAPTQEPHGEGAAHVRPNAQGTFGGGSGAGSGDPSRPLVTTTPRVSSTRTTPSVDDSVDDAAPIGAFRPPARGELEVHRRELVLDRLVAHTRARQTTPIGDETGWARTVRARLARQHIDRIVELLRTHRDDTPVDLIAARVLGEAASTLATYRLTEPVNPPTMTEEVTTCP